MPTPRASGGTTRSGDETTRPEIAIVPARTGSKPARQRSTVVLPHPEGPRRQPMPPASSENDRPRTTGMRVVRVLEPGDLDRRSHPGSLARPARRAGAPRSAPTAAPLELADPGRDAGADVHARGFAAPKFPERSRSSTPARARSNASARPAAFAMPRWKNASPNAVATLPRSQPDEPCVGRRRDDDGRVVVGELVDERPRVARRHRRRSGSGCRRRRTRLAAARA